MARTRRLPRLPIMAVTAAAFAWVLAGKGRPIWAATVCTCPAAALVVACAPRTCACSDWAVGSTFSPAVGHCPPGLAAHIAAVRSRSFSIACASVVASSPREASWVVRANAMAVSVAAAMRRPPKTTPRATAMTMTALIRRDTGQLLSENVSFGRRTRNRGGRLAACTGRRPARTSGLLIALLLLADVRYGHLFRLQVSSLAGCVGIGRDGACVAFEGTRRGALARVHVRRRDQVLQVGGDVQVLRGDRPRRRDRRHGLHGLEDRRAAQQRRGIRGRYRRGVADRDRPGGLLRGAGQEADQLVYRGHVRGLGVDAQYLTAKRDTGRAAGGRRERDEADVPLYRGRELHAGQVGPVECERGVAVREVVSGLPFLVGEHVTGGYAVLVNQAVQEVQRRHVPLGVHVRQAAQRAAERLVQHHVRGNRALVLVALEGDALP